ncbi:MAG: NnrU family protein [Rhodospirillales bacterium]|nr:NnrU family protein [Rhodospirillales bacterium]
MLELVIATAVFVATHTLPAYRPLRGALVELIGERPYLVLYSLVTAAVLVWVGFAYVNAPHFEVWPMAEWMRWVPLLVLPFACILLVAGLAAPNPLSLGRTAAGFDAGRPGIVSVTRHPVMWSLVGWAAAHVPPNGDAASLIVFGLFSALGLAGPPSLDNKRRAQLGTEAWRRLAEPTSNVPFAANLAGRARLDVRGMGVAAPLGGLALYGVVLWGHEWVVGASPLP